MKQKKTSGRIRIKDIARMANVSTGTVDRVIHNRSGVAPESRDKIEKILKDLNFKPNKVAQMLAIKKDRKLIALFPQTHPDDYWYDIIKGIKFAVEEIEDFKVHTEIVEFNQYDAASFEEACGKMLQTAPDGVLLAPFFRKEVLKLTRELEERNVPFVFIDSYIENTNSLAYYGQHSHRSGYTAAKLLFQMVSKGSTILLLHMLRGRLIAANQTTKREEGFMSYVEKFSLEDSYNFVRIDLHAENSESNAQVVQDILEKHQNIEGAIAVNSRIYKFAELFEGQKCNIKMLGYDLLPENVRHLNNGLVQCLIAQRPQLQGYYGLTALANHLVMGTEVAKLNYMPIDILFKENIADYKIFPFDLDLP